MMAAQGSNDDCYFYFYSSCTKGDSCPFRHCQAALGTETVCSLWREGRCFRDNCKFRHMESRINRSSIPCYWENQPTGCCKPHCVFFHQKSRSIVNSKPESKRLILPVSSNSTPTNFISKESDIKDKARSSISTALSIENYSNHSEDVNMSPHPVEPFVVSFDEGEESDSESVSSTPMKSTSESKYNSSPSKRNLMENLSEKTEDFGIKTLEQIRMEKIHKESEHFYKSDDPTDTEIPNISPGVNRNSSFGDKMFTYSAYDAPLIDSTQMSESTYEPESYPPVTEFISVSERPMEKSPNRDCSLLSSEAERDLRSRLLKRKSTPSYKDKSTPQPKKAFIQPSREDDPLNFKIKTLDEIRKERENKSVTNQDKTSTSSKGLNSTVGNISSSTDLSSTDSNSLRLNATGRSVGRIKIKRQSNEFPLNHNAIQVHSADESVKIENRSQMVLHEVQNISEDQAEADDKVKRKETDYVPAGRNKFLKSDTSSVISSSGETNKTLSSSANCEGSVKKLRRPIIRRNMASELSSSASKPTAESPTKNNGSCPVIRRKFASSASTTSSLISTSQSSVTRRSLVSPPLATPKPTTTSELPSKNNNTHSIIRRSLVSPPSATTRPITTPISTNGDNDTCPIIRRSLLLSSFTTPKHTSVESENQQNGSVVSIIKDATLPVESKTLISAHKTKAVEKGSPPKKDNSVSAEINDKNNKTLRSTSVDEFESLLLNDSDLTLDDEYGTSAKDTEDLMLEIEQLLDS